MAESSCSARITAAPRGIGYDRWVSVEMRRDPARDTARELRRVAKFLGQHYGRL